MSKFEESNFYKALQDFFINADKKTFLQFLAEFYNRTEGIIDKNNIQDDLIKELRELYLELNEKGIDENIVREKVNYFLENSLKIKDVISKLNTNTNNIENISSQLNTNTNNIENITSQLDTKTSKEETKNIQQQVNNLVLGAVGDGNNAEVIQARGKHTVLNDRLNSNENDLKNFKDNIGITTINRGKNLLFLKDQRHETNGLTIDIKDQLITISGQVQDTGFHNYIVLDVDMPDVLDGDYSVYSIVKDEQSIAGRNNIIRLKFYNSEDVEVAEKIAFNHLSLSDLTFSNLSDYKVKLYIQAQYTYTQPWSFNLQLASGHNGIYEKAYVNRDYKLNVDNDITALNNEIKSIKEDIGIVGTQNPLSKIITDDGLAGLIESYACCGDSLTQGVFDRTNGVTMDFESTKYYSYPSQLSRITGSKVFNLGNAGATACNSQQSISDWHSWLQTATQKNWFSDSFKAKAYIFSIGTNDIGYYGSFTGNVDTDIDVNNYNNNNTNTSVGGLATMIQKARELQPKSIIFVETIDNTRNTKPTRDVANEKIRAIAEKLNCYLIDMAKYWIQEDEVSDWVSKYQNGGHLNAMGYLLKTQARITYIDWIIRNNSERFKEVQFIGTNMEYK